MNWLTGIVVYILVWWVTLFAVLPLWVTPAEPGDPGHAAGAPQQPYLERGGGGDLARDLRCRQFTMAQLSRLVRCPLAPRGVPWVVLSLKLPPPI